MPDYRKSLNRLPSCSISWLPRHAQCANHGICWRGVAPRSSSMELAGGLPALAVAIQQSAVPVSCLVMSERVIVFCFMDTDRATLNDLAILRVAFEDGTPLGWEAGLDGPLLENLTVGSSVAKFYWLIPISV